MVASLADVYSGISKIDSIPDEQRLWDRDKILVRIAQGNLTMSRIMTTNFKQSSIIAGDPSPKYKSDVDRNILLDVPAASDDMDGGTENKIWVKTKQAIYIEAGSTLIVRGLWNGNNSGTTTWVTTPSTTNNAVQPEMLLVLQRGVAVGNNTWFKVTRGFAPAGGSTGGTPAEITTAMKYIFLPRTVAEGTNEGSLYGDTPWEEQNHCEFLLHKWGVNIIVEKTVILQDETVEERSGRRTNDQFWKGFEMKLINGHKHTDTDADGNRIWYTGGLLEYILQPQTSIGYSTVNIVNFTASYGALSYQTFNTCMIDKFFYGNTQEKVLVLDGTAYSKICNAFDNKIRIPNQELSGRYGIKIESIITSSGTVHLTVHDLLSITGMTNIGFLVDFDYFKYMHMSGLDIQTAENVEKGINVFKRVNYLFGMPGVKRTNPFAHWYFFNF